MQLSLSKPWIYRMKGCNDSATEHDLRLSNSVYSFSLRDDVLISYLYNFLAFGCMFLYVPFWKRPLELWELVRNVFYWLASGTRISVSTHIESDTCSHSLRTRSGNRRTLTPTD